MSMNAPELTRLNDPDTSRNKYINFLSVLQHFDDREEAMTKLRQLAAQVKPLMKQFGLRVNSLEESEYNTEYAGINWNAGESIGLVLRGPSGRFHPLHFVLEVFHHELAHCQFMNHIPSQHGRLTAELSRECKRLQQLGYFGDGFWSSGTNLNNDISRGDGLGAVTTSRPRELCGGALANKKNKKRPKKFSGYRKPRNGTGQIPGGGRGFKGPTLSSGAQTAANTKSSGRMTKAMVGQGQRIDGNDHLQGANRANKLYKMDPNSSFGKSAKVQSARAKIAEAAERRMRELKAKSASQITLREEIKQEYPNSSAVKEEGSNGPDGHHREVDSETEDEMDSEEEAERRARLAEAVQVDDSDTDSEDASAERKGKQTDISSKSGSSSPNSRAHPTLSSSRKSAKQLSELSRKAEGREVGDTWKQIRLESDDDLSKFAVVKSERIGCQPRDPVSQSHHGTRHASHHLKGQSSGAKVSRSAPSTLKRKASPPSPAREVKAEPTSKAKQQHRLMFPAEAESRRAGTSAANQAETIDLVSDEEASNSDSYARGGANKGGAPASTPGKREMNLRWNGRNPAAKLATPLEENAFWEREKSSDLWE